MVIMPGIYWVFCVWCGGIYTSIAVASPCSTGGIRTRTVQILSLLPLPLGYSAVWW